MVAHNVAPTKANLLREKERLNLAIEGYELLERKREILVMELMRRVDEVKIVEREIAKSTSKAYPVLRRMLVQTGREKARNIASGVRADFKATERRIQVAGLSLPSLDAQVPRLEPQASFIDSSTETDATAREFLELLKHIVEAASVRSIVWRLSREVKKTQRRVNALEKTVIPESREIGKFIEESLEERERESMFVCKLLKQRREGGA